MIAPEPRNAAATGAASGSPGSNSAQTLADLYRRCGPEGNGPFALDYLLRVLVALGKLSHPNPLRPHDPVPATEVGRIAELPATAVYGCVLELEEYGLARWVPQPITHADNITAEITRYGVRFLREIHAGESQ